MDILKPKLVWIENRCYRKLSGLETEGEKNVYYEEDLYPKTYSECRKEEEDDECDVLPIKHEEDQFWVSITIPGPLIGLVKGRYEKTKKIIETSTGTLIKIPRNDNQDRKYSQSRELKSVDAVIKGPNKSSICKAYKRIESIIIDGRWKTTEYTHFVSIPMNNESIKKGFLEFKNDILNNLKSARSGISDKLFVHPATLHLTIVMMTLFNDKEKEVAQSVLNKCRTDVLKMLGGSKIKIQVQGIEIMNDDPGEVDVLYGKVRETNDDNFLQIIVDKIADAFADTNLARKDYDDPVKLHVTLMRGKKDEQDRKIKFDARPLFKKYSDYTFGEMTLNEIHISTRYTGNVTYYKPVTHITL